MRLWCGPAHPMAIDPRHDDQSGRVFRQVLAPFEQAAEYDLEDVIDDIDCLRCLTASSATPKLISARSAEQRRGPTASASTAQTHIYVLESVVVQTDLASDKCDKILPLSAVLLCSGQVRRRAAT